MIEVFGAVGTKVVIDRQEYVLVRLHQRENAKPPRDHQPAAAGLTRCCSASSICTT
jgi:hypothetical protein